MPSDNATANHFLSESEQKTIAQLLKSLPTTAQSARLKWAELLKNPALSKFQLSFSAHRELYTNVYARIAEDYLGPIWIPSEADKKRSHLFKWMQERSFAKVSEFHAWSAEHREEFWREAIERLGVVFENRGPHTLSFDADSGTTQILRDSRLNIALSCFQADAKKIAIIEKREDGRERKLNYGELETLSGLIARQLVDTLKLKPQDKVAILMPMTIESVLIYLGCVLAGVSVVSIADSFASDEISTRLRISGAKVLFTQDRMLRGSKEISLLERALNSSAEKIICVPLSGKLSSALRQNDLEWGTFLNLQNHSPDFSSSSTSKKSTLDTSEQGFLNTLARKNRLSSSHLPIHIAEENSAINILFSSGTTSDPKAIVWTQSTPLKCAVDAMLLHDFLPEDICHWPTNLGWMMGPWILWATFLNRATLALYDGAPQTRSFAEFIAMEKITVLGTVPSLVKSWRTSNIFDNLPLSIRCFSSTGECSSPEDMHWLSATGGYRPVIEYCGGTEIGGAYISSTCIEDNFASCFGTPAFGLDFVLLDSKSGETPLGEVFIIPPSIGLSNRLLNKSHFDTYFKGSPRTPFHPVLRRHGDEMQYFSQLEQYRALGRSDDTMNLGGIKVASAEIERCFQSLEEIKDCAAIAITPEGGGPSLLYIAVVLREPEIDLTKLRTIMQKNIATHLNPLFKIHDLKLLDALPRTASNKVLRRVIRDQIINER